MAGCAGIRWVVRLSHGRGAGVGRWMRLLADRNAHVMLPYANFLSPWCQSPSSRAQNRGFCAFLASGTHVFKHFEHKIEVFVRFCPSAPRFRAFRAHNLHFCARGGSRSSVTDDTGAILPLGRCRCRGAEPLGR